MCCLFGMMDYGNNLTPRQRTKILSVLSVCCEVRGTDATGIAYNSNSHLTVYKRPKAAHKLHFRLPADANTVMGHTRMTTQGDERRNYNNHPFYGKVCSTHFALAHNGILHNDDELKKTFRLPKTNIETDSYVAVQLLETQSELSFASLAKTAEQLEGTFTLTVIDEYNNLYLIKGNNPLCLYHWADKQLYLYASTEEILKTALRKMPYDFGIPEKVQINEGEIMKIQPSGVRTLSEFSTEKLYMYGYCGYPYRYLWNDTYDYSKPQKQDGPYLSMLKSMAATFGYRAEDVDTLVAEGFSPMEIEELFYEGELYC